MLHLISTDEAAKLLGISTRRIRTLLQQDRVKGATKVGRQWLIPTPVEILPPSRKTSKSVGVGIAVKRTGGEEVIPLNEIVSIEIAQPGLIAKLLGIRGVDVKIRTTDGEEVVTVEDVQAGCLTNLLKPKISTP